MLVAQGIIRRSVGLRAWEGSFTYLLPRSFSSASSFSFRSSALIPFAFSMNFTSFGEQSCSVATWHQAGSPSI